MILYIGATVVLWVISAFAAVVLGLMLATLSLARNAPSRLIGEIIITVTRGIPTSLMVVAAGVISIQVPPPGWLPDPFPGTIQAMSLVAWAIVIALALGSAGHFAIIFRTAYLALGRFRIEQARVLALSPLHRFSLLARETGSTAMSPAGARLVHHLHNTAFASLFPIADLMGWIEGNANLTFQVTRYVTTGAAMYVALSGLIWLSTKALESAFRGRPVRRTRQSRLPALTARP
jgi:ABC-type amino acid transport system permease subunit